jgi:hypothetical protein
MDDMEKWKFLTPPGLELRPLGRPASSQSLYRLCYPGSLEYITIYYYLYYYYCQENRINDRGDPLCWPRDTLYPQKLALTSPTSGGRSVGIVRLRTKGQGVLLLLLIISSTVWNLHTRQDVRFDNTDLHTISQKASFGRVPSQNESSIAVLRLCRFISHNSLRSPIMFRSQKTAMRFFVVFFLPSISS